MAYTLKGTITLNLHHAYNFTCIGKLPIEVNMNEVRTAEVMSTSAEELPPPIPPRLSD